MIIYKEEFEVVCNRETGELKIKLFEIESTWFTIIPIKLERNGFKKFNYRDILFNHLETTNNYYLKFEEESEYLNLCVDPLYFTDTKSINISEKLTEKFDLDEIYYQLEQDPNNVELLKKIITRQNIHIKNLNIKIDELTERVQNYHSDF